MPAELAAEMARAAPASRPGRRPARPSDFSPLPRRARAPHRAAPPLRRLLRAGRAPLRHPARRLRARAHDRRAQPLFATLRDSLVAARRRAAGDDGAAAQRRRLRRRVRGRRPAPRGHGRARGGRLRLRRLAPRPVAAPVRAVARARRRPHHHPLRPRTTSASRSSPPCTSPGTASTRPASRRSCAAPRSAQPVSLGIHESQSRLWENLVGRSRAVLGVVLPQLREQLGPGTRRARRRRRFYRAVNAVQRSLIRVEADEMTYNLHIILRFELEQALIEGTLAVATCPPPGTRACTRCSASRSRTTPRAAAGRPLGRRAVRLLPDLHARQPDRRPAVERLPARPAGRRRPARRGDFGPLRDWLREHIHRHGRKFPPRELLRA